MNRKAGVGWGSFITLSLLLVAFDSMCGAEIGAPCAYGEALGYRALGRWNSYCSLGSAALVCGFGQVGLLSLWEQIQNGVGIASSTFYEKDMFSLFKTVITEK